MKIKLALNMLIIFSYQYSQAVQGYKFLDFISSYISSWQKYLIKQQFPVVPPVHEVKVALSTDLCNQENIFLQNRLKKVTKVLRDDFGIDAPLKIAFCCSGGGNRAMIGMSGLLLGAAETKLLDATLYLAGTSGSTWAIIPYFYQQACLGKNSQEAATSLAKYFSTALSSGIHFCYDNYCTMALLPLNHTDDFFKDLLKRYAYEQDISLVNLFGPLIAHQSLGFLGDAALQLHWSDMADKALLGTAPLPLCTAAFNDSLGTSAFFEMSPFESGSTMLGYIPTQYLGSKFIDFKLDTHGIGPEHSLGFYMGVYGSAFAIVVQELYYAQSLKNKSVDPLLFLFEPYVEASVTRNYNSYKNWNLFTSLFIKNKIEKIVQSLLFKNADDIYAFFPNYNPQAINGRKDLGLFDAGIVCNFPISTLIDRPQREIDLIIMYDSHPGSTDVAKVYDYAQAKGIPFDKKMKNLSIADLAEHSMLIFNDPTSEGYMPSVATILYFPTQYIDIDKPPYTTFNFKYEINDVEKLKDKQTKALISNFENIKKIMALLANKYKKN